MSTATVAVDADRVRTISASNKSGMAEVLSRKPQSIAADLKGAIAFLPKKAAGAIRRVLRFLHVPQMWGWLKRNVGRVLSVLGTKTFMVGFLASHAGQAAVRGACRTVGKVAKTAVKWAWKVLSLPLRPFGFGRRAIQAVETTATRWTTFSPETNNVHAVIATAGAFGGMAVSADRAYMKVAKIGAVALMGYRVVRNVVPAGPVRVGLYVLEAVIAFLWARRDFAIVKRLTSRSKDIIEDEVVQVSEGLITEANIITREAAAQRAEELRLQARTLIDEETSAAKIDRELRIKRAHEAATELREEAKSWDQEAARLRAAEEAAAAEAAAQEATAVAETAVAVMEPPAPAPSPAAPQGPPEAGKKQTPPPGKRH